MLKENSTAFKEYNNKLKQFCRFFIVSLFIGLQTKNKVSIIVIARDVSLLNLGNNIVKFIAEVSR